MHLLKLGYMTLSAHVVKGLQELQWLGVIWGHSAFADLKMPHDGVNTHDPSIRNFFIRWYYKYKKEFIYREHRVSHRWIQRRKKLKVEKGSLETDFATCANPSTLTPGKIIKVEKKLIKNQ